MSPPLPRPADRPSRAWPLAYGAAAWLACVAGLPVAATLGLVRRELWTGLGERLGGVPQSPLRPAWFQAASVGETLLVEQLIGEARRRGQGVPIALSATTPAGRRMASRLAPELAVPPFHLPVDVGPAIRRALRRLEPRALVLVETEVWPELLRQTARRGIPAALVNGRFSPRSFPRYRLLRGLIEPALRRLSVLAMRGEEDAERALALGAPPERVHVVGNLKHDAALRKADELAPLPWAARAGLEVGPWLVLGSTVEGEEEPLLDAFARLLADHPRLRVVLAPRQPARWDGVARLVERRGLPCVRRSRNLEAAGPVAAGTIVLLDSLGELARLHRHAAVVFVGGSLVPRGGHDVTEPAAAGRPVVFGPHHENTRDAAAALLAAGGGFQVTRHDLVETLSRLLEDEDARREAGAAARAVVEAGAGAAARTLQLLEPLFREPGA